MRKIKRRTTAWALVYGRGEGLPRPAFVGEWERAEFPRLYHSRSRARRGARGVAGAVPKKVRVTIEEV